MQYFNVLFSAEYSQNEGNFGMVDVHEPINEYLLADELIFPSHLIDQLTFVFTGKLGKKLADNQMTYFPWRLISQKMYALLSPYSNSENKK